MCYSIIGWIKCLVSGLFSLSKSSRIVKVSAFVHFTSSSHKRSIADIANRRYEGDLMLACMIGRKACCIYMILLIIMSPYS